MNSTVEILLSTFNGEKYLNAQLESIIEQDYPYWKLLIRDDQSTDGTISVLNKFVQKYPQRVTLLADNEGNLGYTGSFSKLLEYSTADYVMYCDQDDYWHPAKISTMLSVMLEEEIKLAATAHIVFSDLHVTDSELKIVSKSFLKMMNYSPTSGRQVFFLKNYVPGCNFIVNKILVQQALKTDNIINLHDHWLLMVCSSAGKLTYIDKPLMDYRMHDNNAIGFIRPHSSFASEASLFFKDCFRYGLANKKYRSILYSKNVRQIQNICERIPENVSKDAITFSAIGNSNYLIRKIRNVGKPYIRENSILKQLTYVICF